MDATASRFGEGDPTIEYEWLTFSQVGRKAQLLADGLRRVCTPSGVVGICGPNRASWVITDFACCFADLVTVGLHTSWPEDEVEGILQDAGVTAVVCDGSLVPRFSAVAAASGLKAIISMDELDEAACAPAGVTLTTIDALVASSEEACGGPEAEPPRPFLQVASEAGDDMYTLIYASGTSGTPKAIMTPKARWKRDAAAGISRLEHKVAVSYSALAHGMDRGIVWQMVLLGGRIGFAHPDHFFASVRAIGPSLFFAMPHVWNDLYADFNARLDDALREVRGGPECGVCNVLGAHALWVPAHVSTVGGVCRQSGRGGRGRECAVGPGHGTVGRCASGSPCGHVDNRAECYGGSGHQGM